MECSRVNCQREAMGKLCAHHQRLNRDKKRNWRRRLSFERCYTCGRRALPQRRSCALCQARWREWEHREMKHDTKAHAKMIMLSRDMRSRCSLTGLSLLALKKLADMLEVDRIDSRLGYTVGNMRLLAGTLNDAKGARKEASQREINKLLRRTWKIKPDALSQVPGATIPA